MSSVLAFPQTRSALEASLMAVDQPVERSRGLPNVLYTDPAMLKLERERVFSPNWVAIGYASDVADAGQMQPVDWLGEPLVMVRDRAGEVRVFHNVCSHRGRRLVTTPTKSPTFTCPYHAWTYALDGQLKKTPHVGGSDINHADGIDKACLGLRDVASTVWMDMVFVNLSGTAQPFEEWLAPVVASWQQLSGDSWQEFQPIAEPDGRLSVDGNWKLAVENFSEAYHLPWVHPALEEVSPLSDHYPILLDGPFSGQGSYGVRMDETGVNRLNRVSDWRAERPQQGEYLILFPNVFIGLHADHAYSVILEPEGHARTRERFKLYCVGDSATDPALSEERKILQNFIATIFAEDASAVAELQQGRHSTAFAGGVFSPVLDTPNHHFQRWTAQQLLQNQ